MTLIVGLKCEKGVIVCADSQETDPVSGYRSHVAKIATRNFKHFQAIIAGAGSDGDMIDDLAEDILSDVGTWEPTTTTLEDIKVRLREKLAQYYEFILPKSFPQDYLESDYYLEFVLAIRRKDNGFILLRKLYGKTVCPDSDYVAVGDARAASLAILKKHFDKNMSLMRAIMLAVHSLSSTKALLTSVGFDTQIAGLMRGVYHPNFPPEIRESPFSPTMWVEKPEHILELEELMRAFDARVSSLLLDCADFSMPEKDFESSLSEFTDWVNKLRDSYIDNSLCEQHLMSDLVTDKEQVKKLLSDPYFKGISPPYFDHPRMASMSRYPKFKKLIDEMMES